MLILTRRLGESLKIGSNVKVTVVAINGNQIKIGIEAPQDVAVHREEVYERIRAQQQQPAESELPKTKTGER